MNSKNKNFHEIIITIAIILLLNDAIFEVNE